MNAIKSKNLFQNFFEYNNRIIKGTFYGGVGLNSTTDFNLRWRLALIILGISYTGVGIYLFSVISGVEDVFMMFFVVFLYFLVLMTGNLLFNKTFENKVDYVAHLATLGLVESTLFVLTALIAKVTGLPELLFAGQGAGRLLATWLHAKRVENNNYSPYLNYIFATGAILLILYLAYILN